MVDPDHLPVEYGGTGKYGIRSLDDMFDASKALACFRTPEFRAVLKKDINRAKLNLGEGS